MSRRPSAPRLPDGVLVRAGAWAVFVFVLTLPAAMLAVADRVWVAVSIGLAVLVVSIALPRVRGVVAVAGGAVLLGALWGAVAYDSVEQRSGPSVVKITAPEQLTGVAGRHVHRRGQGPLVIDLRGLSFTPTTVPASRRLHVAAQSDTDNLLIALPEYACVRLEVRHRRISLRPGVFAKLGWPLGLSTAARVEPELLDSGSALTSLEQRAEQTRRHRRGLPALVAYGRPVQGAGTWVREASDPAAITVVIDAAARAQVVVRNYPASIDLPSQATWPRGAGPPPPSEPASAAWTDEQGEAALLTRAGKHVEDAHWRRVNRWAQAEAKRWAGPCATRDVLRAQRVEIGRGPTAAREVSGEDDRAFVNGLGDVVVARYRGPASSYEIQP